MEHEWCESIGIAHFSLVLIESMVVTLVLSSSEHILCKLRWMFSPALVLKVSKVTPLDWRQRWSTNHATHGMGVSKVSFWEYLKYSQGVDHGPYCNDMIFPISASVSWVCAMMATLMCLCHLDVYDTWDILDMWLYYFIWMISCDWIAFQILF